MWDILLSATQSERNLFADITETVPAGKEGQITIYTGTQITQVKRNGADRTMTIWVFLGNTECGTCRS